MLSLKVKKFKKFSIFGSSIKFERGCLLLPVKIKAVTLDQGQFLVLLVV